MDAIDLRFLARLKAAGPNGLSKADCEQILLEETIYEEEMKKRVLRPIHHDALFNKIDGGNNPDRKPRLYHRQLGWEIQITPTVREVFLAVWQLSKGRSMPIRLIDNYMDHSRGTINYIIDAFVDVGMVEMDETRHVKLAPHFTKGQKALQEELLKSWVVHGMVMTPVKGTFLEMFFQIEDETVADMLPRIQGAGISFGIDPSPIVAIKDKTRFFKIYVENEHDGMLFATFAGLRPLGEGSVVSNKIGVLWTGEFKKKTKAPKSQPAKTEEPVIFILNEDVFARRPDNKADCPFGWIVQANNWGDAQGWTKTLSGAKRAAAMAIKKCDQYGGQGWVGQGMPEKAAWEQYWKEFDALYPENEMVA